MATGEHLERLVLMENLDRGMSETRPPTSMSRASRGPIWTLLQNLRPQDGELRRESALDSITTNPTINGIVTAPGGAWDSTNNNIQTVQLIRTYLEGEYILCLTTQEIFWYIASTDTWVSLNPIYDEASEDTAADAQVEHTGDGVTFTEVTTSNLLFQTRLITPGMYVVLDPAGLDNGPVTRNINVVNSEKQFTVSGADTGITVSTPIDFSITRTFRSDWFYPMFGGVFNGNLYVTGRCASAGTAKTSGGAPAVIKVTDVFRSTVTGQDAIYLFGAGTLHATTTAQSGGDNSQYHQESTLQEILGLEFLGDGRIVIPTWEDDASGAILNRVRYSDHTDNKEWDPAATSSTAGFSDRTEFPNRLTAVGRLGNSLAFHFPDGIVWGHPTGEQSPPLNYQPVIGVQQGCVITKSLKQTPIGQIFVGTDHSVLLFDGSKVVDISEDIRLSIANEWGYTPFMHSSVDYHRKEYALHILDVPPVESWRSWKGLQNWLVGGAGSMTDGRTVSFLFNWKTQEWRRNVLDGAVTAVSDICRNNPGTSWETRLDGQALVGSPCISGTTWLNGSTSVGIGEESIDLLYRLREQVTTFTDIDPSGTTSSFANNGFGALGCAAVSDDHDAGYPEVYKYWRVVVVWFGKYMLTGALTQSIKVSLSTDEGNTWTQEAVAVNASATTTPAEVIVPFWFDTIVSQKIRVRIHMPDAPYFLSSIRKYAIFGQIGGQIDANFDAGGVLAGDPEAA